jgi:hypothetical protein
MKKITFLSRLSFRRCLSEDVKNLPSQHLAEDNEALSSDTTAFHPFETPTPIALENREQQQEIQAMIRMKEKETRQEHPQEVKESNSESGVWEGLNPQTGE